MRHRSTSGASLSNLLQSEFANSARIANPRTVMNLTGFGADSRFGEVAMRSIER